MVSGRRWRAAVMRIGLACKWAWVPWLMLIWSVVDGDRRRMPDMWEAF